MASRDESPASNADAQRRAEVDARLAAGPRPAEAGRRDARPARALLLISLGAALVLADLGLVPGAESLGSWTFGVMLLLAGAVPLLLNGRARVRATVDGTLSVVPRGWAGEESVQLGRLVEVRGDGGTLRLRDPDGEAAVATGDWHEIDPVLDTIWWYAQRSDVSIDDDAAALLDPYGR